MFVDKDTTYSFCDSDALVIENMPVGEYMIEARNNGSRENDVEKKNSFEMSVKADKSKVTLAYKDYDFAALYGLGNCV